MTSEDQTQADELKEKLDKVFTKLQLVEIGETSNTYKESQPFLSQLTEAMELIDQYANQRALEAIGEDDKQERNDEDFDDWLVCATCDVILSDETAPEYACICTRRNDLRAEQRKRLSLYKGERVMPPEPLISVPKRTGYPI